MSVSPRQLAYKDIFVWILEQVVSTQWADFDDFTDRYVFPDLTTRIPFVITLSQEEFTTLYSAVLTGADLSYPNTSHDVEYLFLQIMGSPMNELCAAIATCILENATTQAALLQYLTEAGFSGGVGDGNAPMSDGSLEENMLPAGYVCTNDDAFGMALAVVDSINDATTEVLQAIEVATNFLELASELGDNIPGAGVLVSAADVANWIQDTAKEQYDLAWSTVIRDELACLLWCAIKADCELSLDMIWDIYLQQSNTTPPVGNTLNDWLEWLILLTFPSPIETVSRISLLGLLALRYGGGFGQFDLGIRSLKTVVALSVDETSSAWSVLCDECCVLEDYDFTTGEHGWAGATWPATNNPRAIYVPATGYTGGPFLGGQRIIQIDYVGSIEEVTIYLDEPLGGDGEWRVWVDGSLIASETETGVSQKTLSFASTVVADNLSVGANWDSSVSPPPTTYHLVRVEACGVDLPAP